MNKEQEEAWNKLQGKVEAYIEDEHGNKQKIWVDPKHIKVSFAAGGLVGQRGPEVILYDSAEKVIFNSKDKQ